MPQADWQNRSGRDSVAWSNWWVLIPEVWWFYSGNRLLPQGQKSCHFVVGRTQKFYDRYVNFFLFWQYEVSKVGEDFANVNLKVILWFERSCDSGKWAIGSSENSRLLKFRLHWDLALADRSFKIQNGRHKTQNTGDKELKVVWCSIHVLNGCEGSLCYCNQRERASSLVTAWLKERRLTKS